MTSCLLSSNELKPVDFPIIIRKGLTFAQPWWFTDMQNNPIPLGGYTAELIIKRSVNSEDVVLHLTTDNGGGITINKQQGIVNCWLDEEDTAELPVMKGRYILKLRSEIGFVARGAGGPVDIVEEVSA